jgi:quercetin dioxygenase-like cupin family protein
VNLLPFSGHAKKPNLHLKKEVCSWVRDQKEEPTAKSLRKRPFAFQEGGKMTFWNIVDLKLDEFRPGINSKAEIGDDLIMVCMEIGPGKEDAGHEHPFDQCGIVLQGQIEMFIGDERRILNTNETYFIPSGKLHGWKTFDNRVLLLDVSLKQM